MAEAARDDSRDYPISLPSGDDPRFTVGLLFDVADVLEQHGYPRPTQGPDLVRLQQALYRLLYVPETPLGGR